MVNGSQVLGYASLFYFLELLFEWKLTLIIITLKINTPFTETFLLCRYLEFRVKRMDLMFCFDRLFQKAKIWT